MSSHAHWTDHLMADFGPKLATLRKARRLTQSQLAELLDVLPPVISRWENGVSKPQFDYVVKLASVLEVSFDDLLGDHHGKVRPLSLPFDEGEESRAEPSWTPDEARRPAAVTPAPAPPPRRGGPPLSGARSWLES